MRLQFKTRMQARPDSEWCLGSGGGVGRGVCSLDRSGIMFCKHAKAFPFTFQPSSDYLFACKLCTIRNQFRSHDNFSNFICCIYKVRFRDNIRCSILFLCLFFWTCDFFLSINTNPRRSSQFLWIRIYKNFLTEIIYCICTDFMFCRWFHHCC